MESGTFDHLVDGILRTVQRQAHEIEAIAASLIGSCCGRALDATLDPLVDDGRRALGHLHLRDMTDTRELDVVPVRIRPRRAPRCLDRDEAVLVTVQQQDRTGERGQMRGIPARTTDDDEQRAGRPGETPVDVAHRAIDRAAAGRHLDVDVMTACEPLLRSAKTNAATCSASTRGGNVCRARRRPASATPGSAKTANRLATTGSGRTGTAGSAGSTSTSPATRSGRERVTKVEIIPPIELPTTMAGRRTTCSRKATTRSRFASTAVSAG